LINNFSVEVLKLPETSIKIQFSKDNFNWYNSTGSSYGWNELSDGSNFIDLTSLDWNGSNFYYCVNFYSDGIDTAVLKHINVSYQKYLPLGTFESEPHNAGGNVTWRKIYWSATNPPDTEIKFQLRTASTQAGLSAKNYVGYDGTSKTNYTTSDTNDIWSGHDEEPWIQYKIYLSTSGIDTPILHDVTITYNLVPLKPTLDGPSNNSYTNDNTPFFDWTFLDTDGTQTQFQVLIASDTAFSNIVYNSGKNNSAESSWQFPDGSGHTIMDDGVRYWKVRTKDNDGDWSENSSYSKITVDTSAPDDIITFSGTHPEDTWVSNNTPEFNWTIPSDLSGIAGYSFIIDHASDTIPDNVVNTSNNFTSYQNNPDGTWWFHVKAIDNATNIGVTYHYKIKVDVTPPEAPEVNSSSHPENMWVNVSTVDLKWDIPSDISGIAGYSFFLDQNPGTIPDDVINTTSNITIHLIKGNGTFYFHVKAIDNATNIGSTTHYTIKIDRVPPPVPDIRSDTHIEDTYTEHNDPQFNWSVPSDISGIEGYSFILDKGITTIPDNSINSSTNSTSYLDVPDGIWYFHVKARDKAGNWGVADHYKIKIDTALPVAPVVSSTTHVKDQWTNNNAPYFKWEEPSVPIGISGYSWILDDSPLTIPDDIQNDTSNSTSYTNKPDGIWYFHVKAQNTVGNWGDTGHYEIRIDLNGPIITDVSSDTHVDDTWANNNQPILRWNVNQDVSGIAGYSYDLDQTPTKDPGDFIDGTLTMKSYPTKNDGIWYFHVKAKDNAGNWGTTKHFTVKIDISPPSAPQIKSSTHVEDKWTKNNAPSFNWSGLTDTSKIAGYSFIWDNNPTTVPDTTPEGEMTSVSYKDWDDGIWYFHVRAQDGAGNWGPEENYTINIDVNGPSSDSAYVSVDKGSQYSNDWILDIDWGNFQDIPGSGIAGYYYSFTNNEGTNNGKWTTNTNGSLIATNEGLVSVYVWAQDKVGNVGLAASGTIEVKLPSAVDLMASSQTIFRTQMITFTSNGFDYTDPENQLKCEMEYKWDGSGIWTPLNPAYTSSLGGCWQAKYTPPTDAKLGIYYVRVRYTNQNEISTDWITESFTVLNNKPVINMENTTFTTNEDNDLLINLSLYESDIEDSGPDLNWTITYYDPAYIIDLHPSSFTPHHLTITPKQDWFGTTYINLTLRDYDDGTAWVNLTLIWESENDPPVVKNPITDFDIPEDGSDSTTVNLNNVFTDVDTSTLSYSVSGNNHIAVTINPDGSVTFKPDSNWYGEESMTFSASDNIAPPATEQIKVTILSVNDVPEAFIDTVINTCIYGKKIKVEGHGEDIDGTIIGYDWTSNIDGNLSTSESFDSSILSLGAHIITFSVQDNNSDWGIPITMSINVTAPDLNIEEVKLSSEDITEGESVTLTAVVENNGDADAANVTVIFYDGDERIGSKSIGLIPSGSDQEVSIEWKPGRGDHNIRVEVETEDQDVIESDTQNNKLSTTIIVKMDWTPWIILISVVIIILFVIAFMFLKKRKDRKAELDAIAEMEAELERARKFGLPTAKLERMLKETKEMGGVKDKEKVEDKEPPKKEKKQVEVKRLTKKQIKQEEGPEAKETKKERS
jgi:hypothetical protein